MDSTYPNVIGIDGGGTRCRGALIWEGQRFDADGDGANATTDPEACVAAIAEVLSQLAHRSGQNEDTLRALPMYLGLAGVIGPTSEARIAQALRYPSARVAEDTLPALVGALGAQPGCLIACGTGSFLARQSPDGRRFAGGYGLALGDEASGAWLGKEALAACLRASDGLTPQDDLTQTLTRRMGGAEAIKTFAASATPDDFGALSRDVAQAAEAGVPSAGLILSRAVDWIDDTLRALGWQAGEALCLAGSVAEIYATRLPEDMQAALRQPLGRPIDGALHLAAEMAP